MQTLQDLANTEGRGRTGGLFWNCEPDTLIRARCNAKLVPVIQLNYRKVIIHSSCELARIWESSLHQGTQEMVLSSEELLMICNFTNFESWKLF